MAQHWTIEDPKRLDIDGEVVTAASLSVVAGSVSVVTHEEDSSAHLDVKTVQGSPLLVEWDGNRLSLKQESLSGNGVVNALKKLAKGATVGDERIELTLSLPARADVTVSTVSAATLVTGRQATTRVRTVSGDCVLSGLRGPIVLTTVSGDTDGEDLQGDLRVKTVSGAVTVRSSEFASLGVTTTSGHLAFDLSSGRSKVDINSVSGDVTLRVPAGTGYAVTSSSLSGDVLVDGQLVAAGSGPRKGSAQHGDAALRINARSVSGDVVVLTGGTPAQDDR